MAQYLSHKPNVEQPATIAAAAAATASAVGTAVATTAATNSSPYGFSQAQADRLVALVNELRTECSVLRATLADVRTVANSSAAALITLGDIAAS